MYCCTSFGNIIYFAFSKKTGVGLYGSEKLELRFGKMAIGLVEMHIGYFKFRMIGQQSKSDYV